MRQKKGMITEKIADTYMIVPTEGSNVSNVLSINESGMFIWNMLEEDRSFSELSQILVKEYGIDIKRADEDLSEFLGIIKDYIEL